MMPKGVEHIAVAAVLSESVGVRIPMMPKGVEHNQTAFADRDDQLVRIPMMPKGVEHTIPLYGIPFTTG